MISTGICIMSRAIYKVCTTPLLSRKEEFYIREIVPLNHDQEKRWYDVKDLLIYETTMWYEFFNKFAIKASLYLYSLIKYVLEVQVIFCIFKATFCMLIFLDYLLFLWIKLFVFTGLRFLELYLTASHLISKSSSWTQTLSQDIFEFNDSSWIFAHIKRTFINIIFCVMIIYMSK